MQKPGLFRRSLILAGLIAACAGPDDSPGVVVDATLVVVTPPPLVAAPGDRLPGTVVVRAVDAQGNPLAGIEVDWSGDGTIAPVSRLADAAGEASVTWQLPRAEAGSSFSFGSGLPGTYRLEAQHGDAPAVGFTVEARTFQLDEVEVAPSFACGLRSGQLWCWGERVEGALAARPEHWHARPRAVSLPLPAEEVAASENSICVRLAGGTVQCSTSWTGQVFVEVANLPPLTDMTDGEGYFCGRALDLTAWCWRTIGEAAPRAVQVSPSLRFASLAAGQQQFEGYDGFACGLDADGVVWCWGRGLSGQLGTGVAKDSSHLPVPVSSVERWTGLEVGFSAACATSTTAETWCWGTVNGANVPQRVSGPGMAGMRMAVPSTGAIAWSASAIILVEGENQYPFAPWLAATGIRVLSVEDQQACVLTVNDDTYCGWILIYGGGDTSLFTSELVAVPPLFDDPQSTGR